MKNSKILEQLHLIWNDDLDFQWSYIRDYNILLNELSEDRTSWTDKYTTAIYSPTFNIRCPRNECQPLPDYSKHMSYITYRAKRKPYWHMQTDELPGINLPTRILDLSFALMPDPPQDILTSIALLAWVTVTEAAEYYQKLKRRMKLKAYEDKQRWKIMNFIEHNQTRSPVYKVEDTCDTKC